MRKHRRGSAGFGTATWRHHRRAAFASRNTGTTLATKLISRCCPLVPEILNLIPSSMAVEFSRKQPRHFAAKRIPSPSDRLDSVRLRSLHCLIPFFLHPLLTFYLFLFFPPFLSSCTSVISVFQSTRITITNNREIFISDRRFRTIEI